MLAKVEPREASSQTGEVVHESKKSWTTVGSNGSMEKEEELWPNGSSR